MTSTVRSITRVVTVGWGGPFVARSWDPPSSRMLIRAVSSTGRVVAAARGHRLRRHRDLVAAAGRYTIRASASVACPGLVLRLSAAWFR